jgi:hypothetical protein
MSDRELTRIADCLWELASFLKDNRKNLNVIIQAQAKKAEFELEQFKMFEMLCEKDPSIKERYMKDSHDQIVNPGTEVS